MNKSAKVQKCKSAKVQKCKSAKLDGVLNNISNIYIRNI